jgi:integrase
MKKERIPGITFQIEMPVVNNEVIETLSKNQLTKLVGVLRKSPDVQISRLMMMALYTGMRKGELLKLKWQDVDSDAGVIYIREPKGKRDVRIPLNQSARDVLCNHPRHGEYVFANKKGEPFRDIRKRVEKIRTAADLPGDFRPIHGLRHVFATTLANSKQVDIYTLQRLLTHRDIKTTSRYAHLLDQRLQDAAAVMDSAINDM